jgi:hypothetical protein
MVKSASFLPVSSTAWLGAVLTETLLACLLSSRVLRETFEVPCGRHWCVTHGASRRWHGSVPLRVAEYTSVHLLVQAVFCMQCERLPLPVHDEAAFPPAAPHMPHVAKLAVCRDVPRINVVLRTAFGGPILHATGRQKEMPVIGVERVVLSA